MIIIVDAYNVLKQIKQDTINQFERNVFIKKLKQYGRTKRHTIVVVFDGGECTWPMIEKNDPVTIVYSGDRLSADDYIRRYIKEHKNKELMLVTNDGELKRNARRYEVEAFDSLKFYALLHPHEGPSETEKDDQLIKLSQDTAPEVDAFMATVGSVPEKKEDTEDDSRKPHGFTVSKKERKISKKIKKL